VFLLEVHVQINGKVLPYCITPLRSQQQLLDNVNALLATEVIAKDDQPFADILTLNYLGNDVIVQLS